MHLAHDWQTFYTRESGLAEWPKPLSFKKIMEENPPVEANAITIRLDTPLRLQHENKLLTTPPPFSLLIRRLIARLNLLAQHAGLAPFLHPHERDALLIQAETITNGNHEIEWVDLSRYSARQKTHMRFGGLTGLLRYTGKECGAFRPWLALAECIHIGNKTTFGLGHSVSHFHNTA